MKKLTVIIPVYNEESTIIKIIKRVLREKVAGVTKDIIVVDDGSRDGTAKKLKTIKNRGVRIFSLKKNQGKGAAIRRGLKEVKGDIIVIQDADLEYDPRDYAQLIRPILDGDADVVYGSRFMGERPHRVLFFWHMVANNMLTLISNMFTNINLTDMETGYKMFTAKVARKLVLKENRFGIEPEFTAKVAKMKWRIFEVGISYHGRNYEQGKKIGWKDGVYALWCILKYNLTDL